MKFPYSRDNDYSETFHNASLHFGDEQLVSIKIRPLRVDEESRHEFKMGYVGSDAYEQIKNRLGAMARLDDARFGYSRAISGSLKGVRYIFVEHETGPEFILTRSMLTDSQYAGDIVQELIRMVVSMISVSNSKPNGFSIEERTKHGQRSLVEFEYPAGLNDGVWDRLTDGLIGSTAKSFEETYTDLEESVEFARRMSKQLIEYVFDSRPLNDTISDSVPVVQTGDVNMNLTSLRNQLRLLNRFRNDDQIPSIKIQGKFIPFDILQYTEDREKRASIQRDQIDYSYYYGGIFPPERLDYFLQFMFESARGGYRLSNKRSNPRDLILNTPVISDTPPCSIF